MDTSNIDPIIEHIVSFWLATSTDHPDTAGARRDWWYRGGQAVDDEIRTRFSTQVSAACSGGLSEWRTTPNGAFALILLLDQFTRNLYRGTADAYIGDPLAFEIVNHAIDAKLDEALHPVARIWLYHPYHHSESVDEQDAGLALLDRVLQAAPSEWHAYVQRSITGWTRHRDIVARFGRFPHRNTVLGRTSTDEERAFMDDDGDTFGQ